MINAGNDPLKETHLAQLKRLQQLTEQEQLNTEEQREAESIVSALNEAYAGLGLGIDKVTGKLKLATDAQHKFNDAMKEAALAELDAEITELEGNIAELQCENQALDSYWNHNLLSQMTGRQDEALRKSQANADQMVANRQKINALRKRKEAILQEILKRGHRNIVIMFHFMNNLKRLQGFHDAMKEAGILDYKERTFMTTEFTAEESNMLLTQMRKKYPGFTAVVSDDDILRIIKSMHYFGIQWEGKIAMAGFGNMPEISSFYPIVTVEQYPSRIGSLAYKKLLQKIKDPSLTVQELTDAELVNIHNIPLIQ